MNKLFFLFFFTFSWKTVFVVVVVVVAFWLAPDTQWFANRLVS